MSTDGHRIPNGVETLPKKFQSPEDKGWMNVTPEETRDNRRTVIGVARILSGGALFCQKS